MNGFCFPFFFFVVFVIPGVLPAQNLVPNGSFEDYRVCPGSYSRRPFEFKVAGWCSVNTGSPDYFNICSKGEAAVPYNWAGVSDPFDGHGYAGIYTWMSLKDYREYLHCKLDAPLVKDSLYHVEFWYKLSSYSKFCTDRIGLLLSDSLKRIPHDRPLNMTPSVTFVKDTALDRETGAWELAVAEYRASGDEQYLTIGNFADNEETHRYYIKFRPAAQPMLAYSAYYYIDDVKVIPLFATPPPEIQTPLVFTGNEPELNTIYILKNIQFEFNSYALMPVSYLDLDKVSDYLLNHPEVFVRLSGHTDDVGDAAYNQTLSAKRAKSAAAYLISKGIAERRITTIGHGERQPLVRKETEEARKVNRRVEIEFYR